MPETGHGTDQRPTEHWIPLDGVGQNVEREFGIPAAEAERILLAPLSAGRIGLRELLKPTGDGYGYGRGAWGRGPWGTPGGLVPHGMTSAEVAALRFETAPLRAQRTAPDDSRTVSWIDYDKPLEIAWFDVVEFLKTTVRPAPPKASEARRGPRYDDTRGYERMAELLKSGQARSDREAARLVAEEMFGKLKAHSIGALSDRLRHGYAKWRHEREEPA